MLPLDQLELKDQLVLLDLMELKDQQDLKESQDLKDQALKTVDKELSVLLDQLDLRVWKEDMD